MRVTDDTLFDQLEHTLSSPSEKHRAERICGLEELSKRLSSGSVSNPVRAFDILVRGALGEDFECLLISMHSSM